MTKTTMFIGFFSLSMLTLSFVWAKNRLGTQQNGEPMSVTSNVMELTSENAKSVIQSAPMLLIVDFYAEWCGPCKSLKPIFEDIAHDLKNQYMFAKINIDKCQNLAKEYQITSIPTILIFSSGKLVQRINGLLSKEALMKRLEETRKGPQDLSTLSEETLNEKLMQSLQDGSSTEEVKRLLDAGADVNFTPSNGLTPLILAIVVNASRGSDGSQMINLLLECGANTEFFDPQSNQMIQAENFVAMMSQNCKRMAENYDKMNTTLQEYALKKAPCTDNACSK